MNHSDGPSFRELLFGGPAMDEANETIMRLREKREKCKGKLGSRDRGHLSYAEGILRRRFLARAGISAIGILGIGGGAAGGLSHYLQSKKERTHELEMAHLTPVPTYEIRERTGPLILTPEGCPLDETEFMEIAEVFTAHVEESHKETFSKPPASIQEKKATIIRWVNAMTNYLAGLDPKLAQFMKEKNALLGFQQQVAFLNRFILARGKFINMDIKEALGRYLLELDNAAATEECYVQFQGREITVPLIQVVLPSEKTSSPYSIPLDEKPRAQTDTNLKAILLFSQRIADYLSSDIGGIERFPAYLGALFKKEGTGADFAAISSDLIKRHETTHIVFEIIAPSLGNIERSLPVRVAIPLTLWNKQRLVDSLTIQEVIAIGVELAGISHYGPYLALDVFTRTNPQYGLALEYLMRTIASLPDLSSTNKKRAENLLANNQYLQRTAVLELIELLKDPAITTRQIQEIGLRMWNFGLEILNTAQQTMGNFSGVLPQQ